MEGIVMPTLAPTAKISGLRRGDYVRLWEATSIDGRNHKYVSVHFMRGKKQREVFLTRHVKHGVAPVELIPEFSRSPLKGIKGVESGIVLLIAAVTGFRLKLDLSKSSVSFDRWYLVQ